jgi:hypothetical protein
MECKVAKDGGEKVQWKKEEEQCISFNAKKMVLLVRLVEEARDQTDRG